MDKIVAILPIAGIRCSVLFRYDTRCTKEGTTGVVQELDGSTYRLTAFCPDHWQAYQRGQASRRQPAGETPGTGEG